MLKYIARKSENHEDFKHSIYLGKESFLDIKNNNLDKVITNSPMKREDSLIKTRNLCFFLVNSATTKRNRAIKSLFFLI